MSFARSAAAVAIVGILGAFGAGTRAADKVKVSVNLALPEPASEDITLLVTLMEVQRDEFGQFTMPLQADTARPMILKGQTKPVGNFSLTFEPDKAYEVRIRLLDKDGNPDERGRYLFTGPGLETQNSEKRMNLAAGGSGHMEARLRWVPRDQVTVANYAEAVPTNDGSFLFILSFNEPAPDNFFQS